MRLFKERQAIIEERAKIEKFIIAIVGAADKLRIFANGLSPDKKETLELLTEQFIDYPISKIAEVKTSQEGDAINYDIHEAVGLEPGKRKGVVADSVKPAIIYNGKVIQTEKIMVGSGVKIPPVE